MNASDAHETEERSLPIKMGEVMDFERIFLLYHAPLRYFCEQLTGVGDECEDIVSQLFFTLWQKQVQFKSPSHAQAYLYRSAKNACLNFIRDGKRAIEKEEALSLSSTEFSEDYLDVIIRTEVWAELYRAIEGLPVQSRKVIKLSFIEGMTNHEIADEMGLPMQTIKIYKMRGLAMLKNKFPGNLLPALLAFILLK